MVGKSWLELPIFHPEEFKVLKSIKTGAFRKGCYLQFTINRTWTRWTNRLREIDGNSYVESHGYAPIKTAQAGFVLGNIKPLKVDQTSRGNK